MRYEDTSGSVSGSATPEARDDADILATGSNGPATGNVITGAGTTTGKAGADAPANGHVVAVRGASGTDSSDSGNSLHVDGRFGTLAIDEHGNYKYVADGHAPQNFRDLFQYTLADSKGGRSVADLVISRGGEIQVSQNAQKIVPNPDGTVTLPAGVDLNDVHVVGRDLIVTMPDGSQIVIVDGAVFVPQLVLGGVEVPSSNLAALLIDAEPKPAAGTPQSSGGNFDVPVPPLDPGVPLGDLIPPTELHFTPPEFQPVYPGVEDREPTIVIQPDGQPASVAAEDAVDEKGLPTRNGGEPAGSGESADGNGSNNSDGSEATTGTIIIDSPDGISGITINGVAVTGNSGQVISGDFGTLTIIGFDGQNILYSYVLTDNTNGNNTHDDFSVTITDPDGDQATATLTVDIIDDVPTARPDADAIAAGQYGPATGNVITDASAGDAGDSDSGADTVGADNAHLSNVTGHGSSTAGEGGWVVQGQYGVLTINDDGSYSYVRNAGTPGGVSDVFNYTLTDGDGDTSSSTLTISIGDLPTDLNVPTGEEAGTLVSEVGLPTRNGGEPAGTGEAADGNSSDNDDTSETTNGVITFTAPDGPATVRIGGVDVTGAPGQTFTGAHGILTVDSYNAATGEIAYHYTLTDNTSGDATTDQFSIQIEDQDHDVANDTLTINIVDDAPLASPDTDVIAAGSYGPATGNVITDASAGDAGDGDSGKDNVGADNAVVAGVASGDTGVDLVSAGTVGSVVHGLYGDLTLNADGSYSYTRGAGTPGGVSDVFTYTLRDGDGDLVSTTLTISINDSPVTIDAPDQGEGGTVVSEVGLPTRNGGEPAGTGEAADGNSSDNDDTSETTNGVITFTAPDGPATVRIGGVDVTGAPGQTFTGAHGILTVDSYNAATGEIAYHYTLTDNTSGDATTDQFSIQIEDQDHDVANDTLTINIVDDAPIANDDSNSVNEGASVGGNVLPNDFSGADDYDGAVVGAVTGHNDGTDTVNMVGSQIVLHGTYGTLTLNSDGSYTYDAAPNTNPPQGAIDEFVYTIRDGDGDLDSATLTISVNDVTLNATDDDAIVNEAGLPTGSNPASNSEFDTNGHIVPSGGTGPYTFTLNGSNVGSYGTLTLNADGSYTYQLTSPYDTSPSANNSTNTEDNRDSFSYTVTDSNGNTTTGTIFVDIIDDVPSITVGGDTSVTEGLTATGTWSEVIGADQTGASTVVVFNGTDHALGSPIDTGKGILTVNADGTWSFQSANNLDQDVAQSISFSLKVTDGDGDIDVDPHTITINDGPPPTNSGPVSLVVDDEALPSGSNSASPDEVDTGSITFNAGSDNLTVAFSTNLASLGGGLTWTRVNATTIEGFDGATKVITLTLSGNLSINAGASGNVTVTATLNSNYDSHPVFTADDLQALGSVLVTASDQDGDSTSAQVNVSVSDDVPTLSVSGDTSVTEGQTATGTWSEGVGADQPGTTVVVFNGTEHALGSAINTGVGTLTVLANGTWSFVSNNNLDNDLNPQISFTVKVTDTDNDVASDSQTIVINDGPPPTNSGPVSLVVDDEALPTGSNPASPDEVDTGTITFHAGSDNLTVGFSTNLGSLGGGLTWTRVNATTIEGFDGATKVVTLTLSGDLSINAGADGNVTVTATLNSNYDSHPGINVDDLQALGSVLVTASDQDGDSTSAAVNVSVSDDVPTAHIGLTGAGVSLDESVGNQLDSNDTTSASVIALFAGVAAPKGVDTDLPQYATNANPVVNSTGTVFGADGGTVAYSLNVSSDGVDSGLNTTDGHDILLYKEGNLIVGRVSGGADAGKAAIAIAIDSTGHISTVEYLSIQHTNTGNPDDSVSIANGAVLATVTATDGDNDTNSASIAIGGTISFQDSGPVLTAVDNINIQNSGDVAATGGFHYLLGADGASADNNVFSLVTGSATVNGTAVTNYTISETSENATSAVYTFGFDYNTGSGGTAHETGTLTFDKSAGTYTVDLANPIAGFSILATAGAPASAFVNYNANGSVSQGPSNIATVQLANNFFIQFTGEQDASGTPMSTTVGHDTTFTPTSTATFSGLELFDATATTVTVSSSAAGVAGNTIQGGEVLDFNLYTTDPHGTTGGAPTTNATSMFIELDGVGGSEDMIVVLKLYDTVTHQYTTKALMVQNGDIIVDNADLTGTAYSGIHLDNNDGLVVIEANDYQAGNSNLVIVGAQIAGSDAGISGTATNFNGDLGASGGSSGTQAFSTDVSDQPFKIQNIGFLTTTTTNQNADLTFNVTVKDGDGDTVTQTIHATVTSNADSASAIALGSGVTTVAQMGLNTKTATQTATNSNSVLMGALAAAGLAASDSLAAATPHTDLHSSVSHMATAAYHSQTLAPVAIDGLDGHRAANMLVRDGGEGMGHVAVQSTSFHNTDMVAAHDMAGANTAHQPASAPLLHGTSAPVHAEPAASQVTAASIVMPAAQQLAAAAHSGATGAQHNQVLGEVLAEALHGGGNASTIDHVLSSLPSHSGGGNPALEALASHNAAAVPIGDSHAFAGFTAGHAAFTMEAMMVHVDAVQTHA